jgi:membrane protein DedA with SNARE-associated domain
MIDFVTHIIEKSGYLGVFFLMLLENIFPPIPSEIIMPFAGFVAAKGKLSVIGVIVSGTAGSVAGTYIWYVLARLFGEQRIRRLVDRYGRWMTVTNHELDNAKDWFERYGKLSVFFGRLIPAIRTLISIPAGLARMSPLTFLSLTTVGSAIWAVVLTALGLLLEDHYQRVSDYVQPVADAVVALIVITYIYRVIRYNPES